MLYILFILIVAPGVFSQPLQRCASQGSGIIEVKVLFISLLTGTAGPFAQTRDPRFTGLCNAAAHRSPRTCGCDSTLWSTIVRAKYRNQSTPGRNYKYPNKVDHSQAYIISQQNPN